MSSSIVLGNPRPRRTVPRSRQVGGERAEVEHGVVQQGAHPGFDDPLR
jgi:hypothetical protein